jgi:ubiquinone/menaquinone biosynthesis C-methylase UbiE
MTTYTRLVDDWETMSSTYLPGRSDLIDAAISAIEEHCPRSPRILDLAGGPGTVARRVVARIPSATVVVVDADPLLIHLGRNTSPLGVEFLEAELTTLDWSTLGRFDAVLAVLALHYFDAAGKAAAIAGTRRTLEAGGPLISIDAFGHPRRSTGPEPWNRWWARASETGDEGIQTALAARRAISSAEQHTTIREHFAIAAASGFDGPLRVLARHQRFAAVWTSTR